MRVPFQPRQGQRETRGARWYGRPTRVSPGGESTLSVLGRRTLALMPANESIRRLFKSFVMAGLF